MNESLEAIHAKIDTLTRLEDRMAGVEDKIATLQSTISRLTLQVDDLENRSRSNLFFYEIPEVEKEKAYDLELKISEKLKGTSVSRSRE